MTSGNGPLEAGAADGSGLAAQLNMSVPWPFWVALGALCVLPALLTLLTWSASHRREDGDSSGR